MEKVKNIFNQVGSLIPGYKGYAERDERRNCDKTLRESIVNKLQECEKTFYFQMLNALKNKDKIKMVEIEDLRKQTNTLMSKVKFAPYGATSFFDNKQIKEDELQLIYQKDFELASEVSKLFDFLNVEDLPNITLQIKNCYEKLMLRNNYIKDFK